jgi:hypothetical protein
MKVAAAQEYLFFAFFAIRCNTLMCQIYLCSLTALRAGKLFYFTLKFKLHFYLLGQVYAFPVCIKNYPYASRQARCTSPDYKNQVLFHNFHTSSIYTITA